MKCDDCQNGNFSLCKHYSFIGSREQGSNADYVVIPEQNAVVYDPSIPYEQAAMFEPATVAIHGVFQNDYQGGQYVAVLGGGTIGMFTMQWCKIFGSKKVVVFDISDERLELAKRLGADEVVNTTKENFMEEAMAITGGNYPAQYFMEHEATQVVSSSYTSNEFVHATPAYVNENTLAVVVSMRGTKETIVAAQVAKDHGASTIAIYVDESGLTEVCDYKIQYDSLAVDESCMGRTNSAVVTMIAMELTQQTEGYAEYETAMAAFDLVDPIYRKAVEYTRPLAAKWAEQNADKPCINVMAQGPLFGAAYVFSICNVQEMLQIDSCTINTCDFFHGPFEILDKRTSLFQLISVGRSRCNDERGIRFVNQYGGERVYQLDAKELGLNDIKDSVSEYFNHLIFAPILNNVYMRALSAVTHKDYMTRRYMWKLDY